MPRKVTAALPLSKMPCIVAKDRHRKSDAAFLRRYGKTKQEMSNCDIVDHADPDYHSELKEGAKYVEPSYNPGKDRPMAEAVVTNSRTVLPTCVAHANDVKGEVIKNRTILSGLRPTLNPDESPQNQRMFNKWIRDRRDRAIDKRNKLNSLIRSDDAARAKGKTQEVNYEPIGDEGLEYYAGEQAANEAGFDVSDLLKEYAGWDDESTEANEPDIGDITYDFE